MTATAPLEQFSTKTRNLLRTCWAMSIFSYAINLLATTPHRLNVQIFLPGTFACTEKG